MSTRGEREVAPWIAAIARCGFIARAVLYLAIGAIACRRAALNTGRPDFVGALHELRDLAGGPVLLIAIAAGLAGYAIWRWTEAFMNPEGRPAFRRADIAVRGAMHAWLGVTVVRLAFSQPVDEHPTRHWTSFAFGYPLGTWAIFLAGLFLLWFAVSEALEAIEGQISGHMETARVARSARWAILALSRAGMATRAVVFGLVGVNLLRAAVTARAAHARDMADVMDQMTAAFGSAALIAIGVGLAAYGAYLIALARWRRMPV